MLTYKVEDCIHQVGGVQVGYKTRGYFSTFRYNALPVYNVLPSRLPSTQPHFRDKCIKWKIRKIG